MAPLVSTALLAQHGATKRLAAAAAAAMRTATVPGVDSFDEAEDERCRAFEACLTGGPAEKSAYAELVCATLEGAKDRQTHVAAELPDDATLSRALAQHVVALTKLHDLVTAHGGNEASASLTSASVSSASSSVGTATIPTGGGAISALAPLSGRALDLQHAGISVEVLRELMPAELDELHSSLCGANGGRAPPTVGAAGGSGSSVANSVAVASVSDAKPTGATPPISAVRSALGELGWTEAMLRVLSAAEMVDLWREVAGTSVTVPAGASTGAASTGAHAHTGPSAAEPPEIAAALASIAAAVAATNIRTQPPAVATGVVAAMPAVASRPSAVPRDATEQMEAIAAQAAARVAQRQHNAQHGIAHTPMPQPMHPTSARPEMWQPAAAVAPTAPPLASMANSPFMQQDKTQRALVQAARDARAKQEAAEAAAEHAAWRDPFALWAATEQKAMRDARETPVRRGGSSSSDVGDARRRQQQQPASHLQERLAADARLAREQTMRQVERDREEAALREYEARASRRAPPPAEAERARREAEAEHVRAVEAALEARSAASSASSGRSSVSFGAGSGSGSGSGGDGKAQPRRGGQAKGGRQAAEAVAAAGAAEPGGGTSLHTREDPNTAPGATASSATDSVSAAWQTSVEALDSLSKWWNS